jgi:hypothetical protein
MHFRAALHLTFPQSFEAEKIIHTLSLRSISNSHTKHSCNPNHKIKYKNHHTVDKILPFPSSLSLSRHTSDSSSLCEAPYGCDSPPSLRSRISFAKKHTPPTKRQSAQKKGRDNKDSEHPCHGFFFSSYLSRSS